MKLYNLWFFSTQTPVTTDQLPLYLTSYAQIWGVHLDREIFKSKAIIRGTQTLRRMRPRFRIRGAKILLFSPALFRERRLVPHIEQGFVSQFKDWHNIYLVVMSEAELNRKAT